MRIMRSSITRREIEEMAKDVIAFLKSKDYSYYEIEFILYKALELNDDEEEE